MVVLQLTYARFKGRFVGVAATIQGWISAVVRYGVAVLLRSSSLFCRGMP
jgi:hypothetical protein